MNGQLRVFATGVQFLTRLPVPSSAAYDAEDLAKSTAYFPLIGAIVGVLGAGVYWFAALAWPPFVAAGLAMAATIWVTGAFHEDGLADAFDGFGGGWDREQVLTIMKDSRIGSYGAVALVVVLALKLGTLASLSAGDAVRALVVGHVVARWSSLPLIRWLPYVRETGGTGRPFAASVTDARLVVGSGIALAIAALALGVRAVPVLAVAGLVTLASAVYFRRRIGGMTGDCLGATNQLVELATYLALSFRVAG